MVTCGYGISMCAIASHSVLFGTRVWRSHFAAKELEIVSSTNFDMRGNTFADEMAGRAATRVEVLPSQANAVQTKGGMAWHVRMRIIEANSSPRVSSYHSVHQPIGKRDSNEEMSCLEPQNNVPRDQKKLEQV